MQLQNTRMPVISLFDATSYVLRLYDELLHYSLKPDPMTPTLFLTLFPSKMETNLAES